MRDRERGARRRRLCLRGFWTLSSESELGGLDSRRRKREGICLGVDLDLDLDIWIGVTASAPGEARSSLGSLVSILWRLRTEGLEWRHGIRI